MFDEISSFKNLLRAYYLSRRNKRSRRNLQKIEVRFEDHIINIRSKLKSGAYKPKQYHQFLVYEPKMRQVSAPAFLDRIVHHAILNVVEPMFDAHFIPTCFACRKGRGTHHGMVETAKCFKQMANKHTIFYVLKCDIRKYFSSINHEILYSALAARITCSRTLKLLRVIIDSYCDTPETGIPIGNLTSQLFANIYLHPLDIYITKSLVEPNYFRYMDDFLVLSPDKEYLKNLRHKMEMFLKSTLALDLHPRKANIFRADCGLDFIGFMIKKDVRYMRKNTLRRYKKRHKKRIRALKYYKQKLKRIGENTQLSLFSQERREYTQQELQRMEYYKDKIDHMLEKLRASRNSIKGFLKYSAFEKLKTGGVKVNGIIIPQIFPRKSTVK